MYNYDKFKVDLRAHKCVKHYVKRGFLSQDGEVLGFLPVLDNAGFDVSCITGVQKRPQRYSD